jgi:hypothetical protein
MKRERERGEGSRKRSKRRLFIPLLREAEDKWGSQCLARNFASPPTSPSSSPPCPSKVLVLFFVATASSLVAA